MIDLAEIMKAPAKPRKVSAPVPNIANAVEFALAPLLELLPDEVRQSAHVWISGSRVSSTVLGWTQRLDNAVDLDVFATDGSAYAWLRGAFERLGAVEEFTERPAENRSHARGEGFKVKLECGLSVDVWYETADPIVQLQLYPADGYAHVRMAYNPLRRALIIVANEAANNSSASGV